ncbi:hypothetical protein EVAR_89160_1 [Eumeta japonica]|uniref:Uncharacterized protein n=1 Tax=Eumeta variegata TaxID=151549 RepID=A0A4C1Z6P2_EUMVA|nr:hypothetical protein EVAR_89160_1 [Eumeta japonica]
MLTSFCSRLKRTTHRQKRITSQAYSISAINCVRSRARNPTRRTLQSAPPSRRTDGPPFSSLNKTSYRRLLNEGGALTAGGGGRAVSSIESLAYFNIRPQVPRSGEHVKPSVPDAASHSRRRPSPDPCDPHWASALALKYNPLN